MNFFKTKHLITLIVILLVIGVTYSGCKNAKTPLEGSWVAENGLESVFNGKNYIQKKNGVETARGTFEYKDEQIILHMTKPVAGDMTLFCTIEEDTLYMGMGDQEAAFTKRK
jgi:uncharacterized lipoprotein YehR (DUF1307 family)